MLRKTGQVWSVVLVVACGGGAALEQEDTRPAAGNPNRATADDWKGTVAANPEDLFEGRFAGVVVSRVGDGIAVRIRGQSSMLGSNEPLYVVDGMTIEPGPGGALVGINPGDIQSIEILKDIGSTSMYGGRGANGVIVIKTKRGR